MSTDTTPITLRLPADLHAALVEMARAEDRSLNNLLVTLLKKAAQRNAVYVVTIDTLGDGTYVFADEDTARTFADRHHDATFSEEPIITDGAPFLADTADDDEE